MDNSMLVFVFIHNISSLYQALQSSKSTLRKLSVSISIHRNRTCAKPPEAFKLHYSASRKKIMELK